MSCQSRRIAHSPATARELPAAVLQEFQERFDCWNRGELDEMQAMYAEDAVFDASRVFVDTPPMQGHERLRRYWDEAWETWAGLRMDVLYTLRPEDDLIARAVLLPDVDAAIALAAER